MLIASVPETIEEPLPEQIDSVNEFVPSQVVGEMSSLQPQFVGTQNQVCTQRIALYATGGAVLLPVMQWLGADRFADLANAEQTSQAKFDANRSMSEQWRSNFLVGSVVTGHIASLYFGAVKLEWWAVEENETVQSNQVVSTTLSATETLSEVYNEQISMDSVDSSCFDGVLYFRHQRILWRSTTMGMGLQNYRCDCDDAQALAFLRWAHLDSETECMLDLDGDGYGDPQISDTQQVVGGTDCDDSNPDSTYMEVDGDCDGLLTDDDCDDADAASTALADDADCDGVITAVDCDDNDSTSTTLAIDGDCDGVLTDDDCDDDSFLAPTYDTDCDGVIFGGTLASGASNSCLVDEQGALVCWGAEDTGVLSVPSEVFTTVSVGFDWACGVATDGRVQC